MLRTERIARHTAATDDVCRYTASDPRLEADDRRHRPDRRHRTAAANREGSAPDARAAHGRRAPGGRLEPYYFTGVRWGASERPFVAIIPANGALAWVCPAFEEARARELIRFGTDVRTWEEDEPYQRIAEVLHDRGVPQAALASRSGSVFSSSTASVVKRLASSLSAPILYRPVAGCSSRQPNWPSCNARTRSRWPPTRRHCPPCGRA